MLKYLFTLLFGFMFLISPCFAENIPNSNKIYLACPNCNKICYLDSFNISLETKVICKKCLALFPIYMAIIQYENQINPLIREVIEQASIESAPIMENRNQRTR